MPESHVRGFPAPVDVDTLEDASKCYKPKSKDQMKSFQVAFCCVATSLFGQCLWESPIQNALFDNYIYRFMANTKAALTHIFDLDSINDIMRNLEERNNRQSFSPGLYHNFTHVALNEQTFLKVVNPELKQTFVNHVASLLTRISNLSDYQKRCLLIFTRSSWTPEDLQNLINPSIIITHAERSLVDIYIDGNTLKHFEAP